MHRLLEFTHQSSEISQDFYPPLMLNPRCRYSLALYSLSTWNSLTNIREGVNDTILFCKSNNFKSAKPTRTKRFTIDEIAALRHEVVNVIIITIPPGSYEIAQLGEAINVESQKSGVQFNLTVEESTQRVRMACTHVVIFPKRSMHTLLGFERTYYMPGTSHVSERLPQISSINTINVECNLVKSFQNGKPAHTLHTFYPNVPTGFKLIEEPKNMLFLPVIGQEISNITLRLADQNGELIDFNNEVITIHLVLREEEIEK